ncbi:hypothetical protein [Spirosoma litoris]
MENLINYLLQFGQLNPRQIDLIKSKASTKKLARDHFYSREKTWRTLLMELPTKRIRESILKERKR